MRTWHWYSKAILALAVSAFAWFVWPTPWRYESVQGGLVRTHRVTGRAQALSRGGWRLLEFSAAEIARMNPDVDCLQPDSCVVNGGFPGWEEMNPNDIQGWRRGGVDVTKLRRTGGRWDNLGKGKP